jgi:chorismate mutase
MSTMEDRTLQDLRSEIDQIDKEIISLLANRFAVTRQVGRLKAQHALPAVDSSRETAQRLRYERLAVSSNIAPNMVTEIFRLVIEQVVREHREA